MKNYNQLLTNTLHLVLIFLLLSFAGCNKSQQNSLVIKIIETSDVHAAVFPYDFIENRNKETSLSNIHQYVTVFILQI
jgi:2',3'-cyclic-nucleotide 2'-phosphodiesterase/3'-nucleotidase